MKIPAQLVVCGMLVVTAGCSRTEPASAPVATPTVTLSKDRAALGSPLTITYKFDVAQNASIDGDYVVFVHVLTSDGEKMWQDDHVPPTPTSRWKPGQTVEYTRTVFVENYPYIGEATIRLGLYNPAGKRLPLNGTEASHQEYVVGKLNLVPEAENIFLLYKDGWHPAEVDASNPLAEWQWTKKTASISFRNPKRDAVFYLEWDARTDLFTPPQQVIVKVAGQPVGTFAADSKDRTLRTFPITAAQLGSGDMAEVRLEVDRTFTGAAADPRELGIRVYNAFVDPR
ncbi:MAG: hypothetical protein H0W08_19970 [Acidobacteria bacterium]|nr:hypothetical protein [Acidobacteriota bacterium]